LEPSTLFSGWLGAQTAATLATQEASVALGGMNTASTVATGGIARLYAVAAAHPFVAITAAVVALGYALYQVKGAWDNAVQAKQQGGWKAVIGELGRNTQNDDWSLFKSWRVDQQQLTTHSNTAADINLGPNAAAGGLTPNLDALLGGGKDAERAAKAQVKALQAVAAAQRELTETERDYIDKNHLAGPATIAKALGVSAVAVKSYLAVLRGIPSLNYNLGGLPGGHPFGLPQPKPQAPIVIPDLHYNLLGGPAAGMGQKMPKPDAKEQIRLTEQMINPFRTAFAKFGEELPGLIFGALKAGSIGALVGGIAQSLGSIFASEFAKKVAYAKEHGIALSGATQAMGIAGMGIATAIQGYQLGQQYGKAKGALAGAAGGAMAGTMIMPGIGTAIGAGIGALAGFFGGRSADKKAKQAMEDDRAALLQQYGGMEKLKSLAESLGVSIGNAFSTKKPAEFKTFVDNLNAALEKQKNTLEGIAKITEGTNARSAHVKTQGDVDVVGAGAIASFGLQIQNGASALTAFASLQPAITAIQAAMKGTNLAVSESVQKFLELGAVLEANRVQFENLAADGQILQGMMQGNIRDFDLFRAVAQDIGVQLQGMIDKGVPTAQVFAMAQPQLQALWEAQQKWHFAVDDTTQALINQAVEQGFVGASMKSINQQILDVLVAIGHVLGADIPQALAGLPGAAQAAADGMNSAFDTVRPPRTDPYDTTATSDSGDGTNGQGYSQGGRVLAFLHGGRVPQYLARGSWVNWRPQGSDTVPAMLTPGEIVLNAAQQRNVANRMRGNTTVIFELDGRSVAEGVVPHIPGVVKRFRVGVR